MGKNSPAGFLFVMLVPGQEEKRNLHLTIGLDLRNGSVVYPREGFYSSVGARCCILVYREKQWCLKPALGAWVRAASELGDAALYFTRRFVEGAISGTAERRQLDKISCDQKAWALSTCYAPLVSLGSRQTQGHAVYF